MHVLFCNSDMYYLIRSMSSVSLLQGEWHHLGFCCYIPVGLDPFTPGVGKVCCIDAVQGIYQGSQGILLVVSENQRILLVVREAREFCWLSGKAREFC